MKKPKQQEKAFELFAKAAGKISNSDIASRVKVSPHTVGKWKKSLDWVGKLAAQTTAQVAEASKAEKPTPARTRKAKAAPAPVKAPARPKVTRVNAPKAETAAPAKKVRRARGPRAMRKPEVFEQARKMFLESGGTATNTAIAKACGVTLATLATWKKMPQWSGADKPVRVEEKAVAPVALEPSVAPVTTVDLRRVMENLTGLNQTLEKQIMSLVETKAQVLMGIQQCEMVLKQMKG